MRMLKVSYPERRSILFMAENDLHCQLHWKVTPPILVSAYTNAAVDNLAAGLRDRGLKTLRFGALSRIHDDLKEMTMDSYMAVHPLVGQVDICVAQLAQLDGTTDPRKLGEDMKYLSLVAY